MLEPQVRRYSPAQPGLQEQSGESEPRATGTDEWIYGKGQKPYGPKHVFFSRQLPDDHIIEEPLES